MYPKPNSASNYLPAVGTEKRCDLYAHTVFLYRGFSHDLNNIYCFAFRYRTALLFTYINVLNQSAAYPLIMTFAENTPS